MIQLIFKFMSKLRKVKYILRMDWLRENKNKVKSKNCHLWNLQILKKKINKTKIYLKLKSSLVPQSKRFKSKSKSVNLVLKEVFQIKNRKKFKCHNPLEKKVMLKSKLPQVRLKINLNRKV